MIVRIGLAPRRKGLGTEEFQAHWHDVHAPLVTRLVGLRRYWQNHALLRDGEPLLPWPGFDACTEMQFDDTDAMKAAFAGEHYQRGIKDDTAYLIDKSRMAVVLTERIHLAGRIEMNDLRLMTFMRRAPGRTDAEFRDALRTLPAASTARAHELFLPREAQAANQPENGFDAVDVQWFGTSGDAERYIVSTEAREHRHEVAPLVRGVERLIARVRVIV